MDDQIRPYVTFTDADRSLDTPYLQLDIDSSLRFLFTIRRLPTHRDHDSRPCLFKWSPVGDGFVRGGFILLCHVPSADGDGPADESIALQKVEIAPEPNYNPALVQSGSVRITKWTPRLWELKTGESISFQSSLPEHWERQLRPGETYELLWPGGTIGLWDWGSKQERLGQELRACSETGRDVLVLPGGVRTLFSVRSVPSLPVPRASPEPVRDEDRVPGAPILSVELQCPPTIHRQVPYQVTGKVHYHPSISQKAKAITFHTVIFHRFIVANDCFQLYRRKGADLEPIDTDDPHDAYRIYDDPDVLVNVTGHDNFTTLRPGESWAFSRYIQGRSWTYIPRDAHVGETFCVQYHGGTVNWWDWGGKEDHAGTKVTLSSSICGRVVDPADNGGRPRLVIPASNIVEFTLAGSD
ncbi:uncharacterized protein N7482_008253 [Penicillium canariense]|uniref:Uncharacterized protein n=1 Tax=Penicillium canariense TaxID=189055 RepID=A0A9W9LIE4_9EURO|nr:uncharacterized protein N7482_008253 [Penicillium canariense]KAJ5157153.1 hypothetical protein N7482_008253 [Penicillium canariense]